VLKVRLCAGLVVRHSVLALAHNLVDAVELRMRTGAPSSASARRTARSACAPLQFQPRAAGAPAPRARTPCAAPTRTPPQIRVCSAPRSLHARHAGAQRPHGARKHMRQQQPTPAPSRASLRWCRHSR
jgi:hypothetical protein